MPAETKTGGVKVEAIVSRTLRDRFKKHCKKMNISVAQRLRDLMQLALKSKATPK